jgi:hypothetical protein
VVQRVLTTEHEGAKMPGSVEGIRTERRRYAGCRSPEATKYRLIFDNQMGDVTEVTDPLGRSVIDVYNSLGEKTEETDPSAWVVPDGGGTAVTVSPTTYYGYDADGNVQYVTEPRGDSDVGGDGPGGATYTTWYFYLCLCQLAVTDFSMFSITLPAKLTQPLRWAVVSRSFCYRCSQGTSRCSLAHRSMAA